VKILKKRTRGYMSYDVYNIIKQKIITLQIKPGETLREKELEKELAVGRTPIREAILKLKAEYLLDNRPNEAPIVKEITLKSVRDFFITFMDIEKLVMRLAAQKMTAESLNYIKLQNEEVDKSIRLRNNWDIMCTNRIFHSLIAKTADNEYVTHIYDILRNQEERLSYLAISEEVHNNFPLDEHLNNISRHHFEMISALESNDTERAEKLAEAHIRIFQQRILMYLNCGFTD
jgi:GntR family transcriptional regulator, rspAB operon transcriptional repressor